MNNASNNFIGAYYNQLAILNAQLDRDCTWHINMQKKLQAHFCLISVEKVTRQELFLVISNTNNIINHVCGATFVLKLDAGNGWFRKLVRYSSQSNQIFLAHFQRGVCSIFRISVWHFSLHFSSALPCCLLKQGGRSLSQHHKISSCFCIFWQFLPFLAIPVSTFDIFASPHQHNFPVAQTWWVFLVSTWLRTELAINLQKSPNFISGSIN